MRELSLLLLILVSNACATRSVLSPMTRCPTAPQGSLFNDSAWTKLLADLERSGGWGSDPQYPEDFFEVAAGAPTILMGRWGVDWEGSIFQECSFGRILVTSGLDDALMKHVRVGRTFYDWDGCLDVTVLGAIADLPSPYLGSGPWLKVLEVVEVKKVRGHRVGGECFD